jgi:pimeloyl-ACP methyl ester carboxylesterase
MRKTRVTSLIEGIHARFQHFLQATPTREMEASMSGRGVITALGAVIVIAAFAAQSRTRDVSAAASAAAEAETLRFSRVRLGTGVELEVAQRGPVNGRPVLFLHGYTDSWFSYARILDSLPANVRAIVPTQRGHGDSDKPACCYALADFARDAITLLDSLGIDRVDVVGHSMGSLIAQRIAVEYPTRVDKLVLVGSGVTARTPAVLELNAAVQELRDSVPVAFAREFQTSMATDPLPPAFLERVIEETMKVPPHVWRDALQGLVEPAALHDLAHIRARTLIIWGDRDMVFPRDQQDGMLRAIARSRLLAYEGVGHSPQWEVPARFVADLESFLARAPSPTGAHARQ